MRVAIDCEPVGRDGSGNDMYLRGLVAGLIAATDEIELVLVGHRRRLFEVLEELDVDLRPTIIEWHGARSNVTWGVEARRAGCTALVASFVPPPFAAIPVLTIIHDVSWRHHPDLFPRRLRYRLEVTTRWAVSASHRIITTAESTARDIAQQLRVDPSFVVPIGGAGNPSLERRLTSPAPATPRNGPVLAVGNLHPRKNLRVLAQACSAIDQELEVIGTPIWGHAFPRGSEFRTTKWLGRTDDATLAAKLSTCVAFVYPSVAEGFGMPLVEALQCGAPVVASDLPSSREVLGDAGLYFPASDAGVLASHLGALRDPQLRAAWSARAIARGRCFSWERVGQNAVSLLSESLAARA